MKSKHSLTLEDIVTKIDQTDLRPEASAGDIKRLCLTALRFNFHAVCVNPHNVPACAEMLKGSPVKVCTVIGFPLGANSTAVKAFEAHRSLLEGADELDMVMNIGEFKSKHYSNVSKDILAVRKFSEGFLLKVIVESCLLSRTELRKALEIVIDGGADYIKTSTGFNKAGAALEDIKFLKKYSGGRVKIKASGGIRNYVSAIKFLQAGADRIGTSKGLEIIKEVNNIKRRQ